MENYNEKDQRRDFWEKVENRKLFINLQKCFFFAQNS